MSQLSKKCEVCGKEFQTKQSHYARRRTCSVECSGKLRKGNQNNNFRDAKKEAVCVICGKAFTYYPSARSHPRCCSTSCSAIDRSVRFRGEFNPSWAGGYRSCYGPDWVFQSQLARRRDGHACQNCGATEHQLGKRLDVHHIRPFRLHESTTDANRLDNLISLCRKCHLKEEIISRKKFGNVSYHPMPHPESGMYTPAEAARILGLSVWSIYSMIKRGQLAPLNAWAINPERQRPRYMLSQDEVDRLVAARSK